MSTKITFEEIESLAYDIIEGCQNEISLIDLHKIILKELNLNKEDYPFEEYELTYLDARRNYILFEDFY